ncbi:hypothetical protein L1887_12442 [Cichorium endivia]|nr:hypothetical protein L1887_12442 [Cichorium endivia]
MSHWKPNQIVLQDQQINEALMKTHDFKDGSEKPGATANAQSLLPLMETLKVSELEKMIQSNDHEGSFDQNVNNSSTNSIEKLNLAKMELASKLREIISLKRQHDEIPTQSKLIQNAGFQLLMFISRYVLVRNVPPDPDESVSEHAQHFFIVNHPDQYLVHKVRFFLEEQKGKLQ